jgi:hypothetical protein
MSLLTQLHLPICSRVFSNPGSRANAQPCRQHFSSGTPPLCWLGIFALAIPIWCIYVRSCQPEHLHMQCPLFGGWLSCAAPSSLLITASPLLLHVAKPPLDIVDCGFVTGVLADVVADLNSVPARSGRDLDHNVERYRLLPSRLLNEIICCCQLR